MIETARKRLALDEVWVVPARGNPLKWTATPFATRLAAARSRLAGPRARVLDVEARLGLTYTIHLVRALARLRPSTRFVLVIGADSLAGLHRWRRWRELAQLAPFAVVSRPDAAPRAGLSPFARTFATRRLQPHEARRLAHAPAPAFVALTAPFDPSSSTRLREMAASRR